MCLSESWFSQGISPVMELLGHMVVLKRCLCQQFRDGRSTRQEEGGSDAGGKLQVYTLERCVMTEAVGLGGGDQC